MKYEGDIANCHIMIQKLQNEVESMHKDNYEKDRLIQQLRNNTEVMDSQINEITKERDQWKNEADLFKTVEYNSISILKQTQNDNENEAKIREFKDQIFSFLMNERNKGADQTRVDFYKGIINLLMFANGTEKEERMDLKALVGYFTSEGKKSFGPSYVFHNISKDDLYDSRIEQEFDVNFDKSEEKHNKSETRIATSQKEFNRAMSPESTNLMGSNDGT